MKWVLIVATWVSSGNVGGGYHVSSVPDFTSQSSCQAAASATLKATIAAPSPTKVECVQQ